MSTFFGPQTLINIDNWGIENVINTKPLKGFMWMLEKLYNVELQNECNSSAICRWRICAWVQCVWSQQATWWKGTCCRPCWRGSGSAAQCCVPALPIFPPPHPHLTTADGAQDRAWPCWSAPAPTETQMNSLWEKYRRVINVVSEMHISIQGDFHLFKPQESL